MSVDAPQRHDPGPPGSLPPPPAARPRRPTTAWGLAAALVWIGAAWLARRRLGWYPPPTAVPLLAAGLPVVLVLGFAVGGIRDAGRQRLAGVVLLAVALLAPSVMANHAPGVRPFVQVPLPGRPTIAISGAPEGNFEIWLVRGDAEHLVQLTATDAAETGAQLSPGGGEIVYQSNRYGSYDLFVSPLEGDRLGPARRLTDAPRANEVAPRWSPDGSRILFTVVSRGTEHRLWVVDAGGGDATPLTPDGAGEFADWSPDGTRIVFAAPAPDDRLVTDIWVMDADGAHPNDEIHMPIGVSAPYWSPDGGSVAFTGDGDVWTCTLPCTEPVKRTPGTDDSDDYAVGWTPDGHVLFASDRSHTGGRLLYFVDDAGEAQLTLII